MYSFKLFETEGEVEFYVGCGIGIVGKLLMVVEPVVFCSHAEVYMPLHAVLLPFCKPFHLGSRTAEELHLHLFEFLHAENELPGHDLVAEGLTDLGDSERNLHTAGLLDVEIFDEYTLGRFRTKIKDIVGVACRGALGAEHEVELTHLGPVGGSGNGADDSAVDDYVPVSL